MIASHRRKNKLECSSPSVSGSASPSWVVLVGMDLELIRFILHVFFFFQSRSLSLEALKKYRLLLITFTCSGGLLLRVKQPSESEKDFVSVPKSP